MNTLPDRNMFVQVKYSIVLSTCETLRHKIPAVTIISTLYYWWLLLKGAFARRQLPFMWIRRKKMEVRGKIESHDIPVEGFSAKDIQIKNSPVKTEVFFYTGREAVAKLKELAMANMITEKDFEKILSDRQFHIREERMFFIEPQKHNLIVTLSCHTMAKKAAEKVRGFLGLKEREIEP